MNKTAIWINAMRLRTLPLSVSGVITGSAVAYRYNQFSWGMFIPAILTTLMLQILSNFANDYGDAKKGSDGELRIGPQRMVQSGMLSFIAMKKAIVAVACLAFLSGLVLISKAFLPNHIFYFLCFLFLGLLAIWAALKYTIGKSAYGYRGLGDLYVMLFFGFVSVCGTAFLYMRVITVHALLQSVAVGCMATGVLHLNNMRDRQSDGITGKKTIAVILGSRKSKLYFNLLMIVGLVSALVSGIDLASHYDELAFSLIIIPIAWILLRVNRITELSEFNLLLKPLALSTFAYSILLFTGYYL